ncbi:hypothetical protein GWK47_037175 [Chionoecetes opilio]|uniref:Uncharacterized protein n=1 Tax=Chionoecetes opilio TaxID=41210 RepID=A0A8J4YNA2_CHIOP|nr:hypothetical protein GWK47_037175 [Chionoecetes opilio]
MFASPFQRRDDHKVIELQRPVNTIRARFGQKTQVAGGGEVEPWGAAHADDDHHDTTTSTMVRRNSTPGGANREFPASEGPSVRRHSMPHSSRSLTASPERRLARDTAAEDHQAPEGGGSTACGSAGITITCEDAPGDTVEKLHEDIERNCHLLEPEEGVRGRRSRSTTPTPMDTIPEDQGDKARDKGHREAVPNKRRAEPPLEEPEEPEEPEESS